MQGKNEKGYVMIEVRLERYVDGIGSNITLNRQDRSKLEHTTLGNIEL